MCLPIADYTDAYDLEVKMDGPIVDTKLNCTSSRLAVIGGGHLLILDTFNVNTHFSMKLFVKLTGNKHFRMFQ